MEPEVWASIISSTGAIIAAIIAVIARKRELIARKDAEKAKMSGVGCLNAFGAREVVDASIPLDERVKLGLGIKEIRVLNFASSSILSPGIVDFIGLPSRSEFSDRIEDLVCKENIKLTLIINAPESEAAKEAITNGKIVNQNTDCQNRDQVFYQAYAGIQRRIRKNEIFYESFKKGNFKYRVTTVSLPYAIFQVKYEDETKNHIKIDLYSPYISSESKRRTFYIFSQIDPENYKFFEENFDNVYKNAMASTEEYQHTQRWIDKAGEFGKEKVPTLSCAD